MCGFSIADTEVFTNLESTGAGSMLEMKSRQLMGATVVSSGDYFMVR